MTKYRLTLHGPSHLSEKEGMEDCWMVVNALADLAKSYGPDPTFEKRVEHEGLLVVDLCGVNQKQINAMRSAIKSAEGFVWASTLPFPLDLLGAIWVDLRILLRRLWYRL